MDLWLPPKPAIILPAPRELLKPKLELAMLPGIVIPRAGVVVAPPALEFRNHYEDTSDLTTYTFNNVDIGAADGTRRVIVGISAISSSTARTLSSATIGGVSATIHVNNNLFPHTSLISAVVTTGTTATVSLTFSNGMNRAAIGAYRLVNETSSSPHATAGDTTVSSGVLSVQLNVPVNGALVAACINDVLSGTPSFTWSGATERYDAVFADSAVDARSGASESGLAQETNRTVSATLAGSSPLGSLAVLTWG